MHVITFPEPAQLPAYICSPICTHFCQEVRVSKDLKHQLTKRSWGQSLGTKQQVCEGLGEKTFTATLLILLNVLTGELVYRLM